MGSLRNSDAKFYSTLPLKWSDGPLTIHGIKVHPDYRELLCLNYADIQAKIDSVLWLWSVRNLTPLGKIEVVNTLCNSQFVYRFQCLPSPPASMFENYKRVIVKFIWSNKKAKIAYKWLINAKETGGLQLRDLEMVDKSLKLAKMHTFVKEDHFWVHVVQTQFGIDKGMIPRLNLKNSDAGRIKHRFFASVCAAWADQNFQEPEYCNDIFAQIVYHNSYIKINGSVFFDDSLYKAGIYKIIHLFNLDYGRFYTYEEFVQDYGNIVSFLWFYQIISAIPIVWKCTLLQNSPSIEAEVPPWCDRFFGTKIKITRFSYMALRDRLPNKIDTLVMIWNNDLKTKLTSKEMKRLFCSINRLSLSTKLRYFQYRVLSKASTTNVHVSKYHEDVTDCCTFCAEKPETIVHMLFECRYVQKLLKALKKWLGHFHNVKVVFTVDTCILNNYKLQKSALVNTLLLVLKFYIYRTKVQRG